MRGMMSLWLLLKLRIVDIMEIIDWQKGEIHVKRKRRFVPALN